MKNVIFIGMPASGKSTVGVVIAKRLGYEFIDTDLLIQKQEKKLLNVTYTPDFVVTKDKCKIYLDVKGMPNDTYPIKKKLFLKVLEERNDGYNYLFIEPHNIRQINQAIEIIKNL